MNNKIYIEAISEKHQQIAGGLIISFRQKYNSVDNKIKSAQLVSNIKGRGYKIDDAELREVIGHIRRNDLLSPGFLLSDNGGYWYSELLEDMAPVYETEYGRALKVLLNFRNLRRRIKHLKNEENKLL